jgi:hypothetical protein
MVLGDCAGQPSTDPASWTPGAVNNRPSIKTNLFVVSSVGAIKKPYEILKRPGVGRDTGRFPSEQSRNPTPLTRQLNGHLGCGRGILRR